MAPLTSIPIWLVAVLVAVSAPWIVHRFANAIETRARRRAEALFGVSASRLDVPRRPRLKGAADVAPFRARK